MLMTANQAEMEYKWLDAAKFYEQGLHSKPELDDVSFAAESWKKIGFCYDLASRQAKDAEEFKELRHLAIAAYERAAGLFSKESGLENQAKGTECLATAEYLRAWLASDSAEKRKTLDKGRMLAQTAMQAFKKVGNVLLYSRAANLLSKILYERLHIGTTGSEQTEFAMEGINAAEDAVSVLSKTENKDELALAYSLASLHAFWMAMINEHEEDSKNVASKSVSCAEHAMALSKEVDNPYHKAMSLWAGAYSYLYYAENVESALQYAKEMFEQASTVRDNYLKGVACYLLAHILDQKSVGEANPDKKKQIYEDIIKYAEDGTRYLDLVFQDAIIADTYLFAAQTYSALASDFAVTLSEKLLYSKKAIDIGRKGLEYAVRSDAPGALISALHGLSKAYYYHSNLEPKKDDKPELLRESLGYRKELVRIVRDVFPSNRWVLGVGMIYAAQIETELSKLEKDEKSKITLLESAIADMREGVTLCKNWPVYGASPSFLGSVANYEDTFGGILDEGYSLTLEKENLIGANEVYGDAAEDFKRVDLPSRVAESYWKIAKNLDRVDGYDEAAKNFENAFAAYKAAAQRIVQFSGFYLDYALYMKSWSEIELAKGAHSEEKYEVAMQHYEKTSQLLRQSKSWMYLSLNFYAWSLLEQAEDLSRKENNSEAIEAFEKATKFFEESKRILSVKLESIDKNDERALVKRLTDASNTREEYSRGRIAIEEAKILDKKGDHLASSEKYDKAAAIFQKISLIDPEQTGKEAKPLAYLCRAWQKMTTAEARGSPIMYEEAAELFKLANEHTPKESASLMALGHSSFCKALEAGTEFEITRTMVMYEEAVRHMDAAAAYYLKAGFETTSDYAKATKRLFDAYVFMESAKREREPGKQAGYYSMAEKVLQTAAECFEKAKYQYKTDQVEMLLKKVKEERELSLTLNEIFHAPVITSSTASFSTLGPREESAVGLERFEHADVQAKLVQHETETKVGSTVTLEIQIVNVGKEPLSLLRIENLVPAGFQLVEKPDYCQFEDLQLTMRGKRLEPLKTDEMKITLRSFKKGTIEIKPRIVCLDWVGRPVVYNPEPVVFNISAAVLPGRVPTGFADLDNLLFGGIPENYAVILASPSCDEREQLIRKFLEAGVKNRQATYYITAEAGNIADLAEEFQSYFTLFICNPRSDVMIKSLPNVLKLKGIESLTDIDIALVKSFRSLDTPQKGPRRICITIISDVLLQHHAVITRKWLSALLPDLKAKGFTTLAVINSEMHPHEETQAILGLFEGEIRISEKETEKGIEKILRIRKLYNQRYLDSELTLTRERLES
jgi:KaiC/GvpD/RAD55 family RecA-like ATPase